MKRPGAASCTTRASIATCTGWRVNGEMIPQPIVSRSVSTAISAETTVDERASIPCLRHQGYASASQIVSKPLRSSARAVASISASGSIVSCITPTRNGGMDRILPGLIKSAKRSRFPGGNAMATTERRSPASGERELVPFRVVAADGRTIELDYSSPRAAATHDELAVVEQLPWFESGKPLRNWLLHETDFYDEVEQIWG